MAQHYPAIPTNAVHDGQRGVLDIWFRPKRFENERLYRRLGARVLKRYLPTGGDIVMRRLRRRHPDRRLVRPGLDALRQFERWTRVAETVHLTGFAGFAALTVRQYTAGALGPVGVTIAVTLNLTLGLWPAVLQRYNRLRAYRAIDATSRTISTHPPRSGTNEPGPGNPPSGEPA
jgi:Glycosyl-4,4'-diaponeurosporenoate acyltransferase